MRGLVAAVFVGSIIALLLVSGCTDILSKQKVGGFGDASKTTGTGGSTGGVSVSPAISASSTTSASPATSACPDTLVWDGSWDSREVGYASNHDVREAGVWNDAGPVPVTLTQKCWDATGTFMVGDCPGTLTGKIEKNVFSGKYTLHCTNTVDSSSGTFSVTMASDNQSFMGSMYKSGGYGPENGFPPSWWGKKTGSTGTDGTSGAATVPGSSLTTAPLSRVTTGASQTGTTEPAATVSQGSCSAGLTQCRVFSTDYCVDLNTDPKHCGKCRFGCYLSNAENGCSGGKCYVKSCLVGWANCNGKDEDGCEIDLDSDDNNCGQCGRVCSLPNSHAICVGQDGNGKCGPEFCTGGWTNENGLDEDGCEVPPK
jgi:hypothetical protein